MERRNQLISCYAPLKVNPFRYRQNRRFNLVQFLPTLSCAQGLPTIFFVIPAKSRYLQAAIGAAEEHDRLVRDV